MDESKLLELLNLDKVILHQGVDVWIHLSEVLGSELSAVSSMGEMHDPVQEP